VIDQNERDGVPYQVVIRCGNSYGASIVRGPHTYGGPQGLFELGVVKFENEGADYHLTYKTPITDDVIGWLTEEDVIRTVEAIAALPPAGVS
jgi:hypothetical protein